MPETVSRLVNVDKLKVEIAEALNIAEVAERLCGVELQRSGSQWVGLCPMHHEDSPSFYLNPNRGLGGVMHCFGCKAGGDSIDLVRRVRNLEFIEALYLLAAEADVEISDYERPLTEEEKFRERLRSQCEGWISSLAPDRVTRVGRAVAIEFGVGWSPGVQLQGVEDYLTKGVIFPYRMPNGRLVGWKARELDSKTMYGTPNGFPLHEETLFGIQVAREHLKDGQLILVEGEYDCLAVHEEEVHKNVAAMGGSKLTPGQMEMLESLHVREVTILLDGDDAGRVAAHSIAERFWSHSITVRLALCPEGEDPDSLCREHGDFAIDMLVRGARHALEYLLWTEWQARPRETLSSKLEFVSWIRETYGPKLRATDEALVLQEVAGWLELPEIEVRDFIKETDTSLQVTDSERVLLSAAVSNNSVYIDLRRRFVATDFYMVKHQRIWDILGRMLIDGLTFDVPTVGRLCEREGISPSYVQDLSNVSSTNLEYHEEQVIDMALRRASRDEALSFKNRITDLSQPSEFLVGELTQRVTERVLRKAGTAVRMITDQVDNAMEVLHERMRNPSEIHGLDLGTQFPDISRTLQGLQQRRLVLLSAISGAGKSTMMIQWSAALAVHQSVPCDVISLEMDEVEILTKMAAHMTGIDSMLISGGRLDQEQMKRVEFAMARIRKSPLHIWAPDGMNAIEFLLYARESVMQRRTEAFFIDYVQLTDPDPGMERESGYTQYGHFGRMAKMKVARAMDVCVVCCAQLRREAANKPRPTKEDMGDSYALVRHADVICIICGEEDKPEHMDFWIDKNRQGIGGNVLKPIGFDRSVSTFYETSGAPRSPEYIVK